MSKIEKKRKKLQERIKYLEDTMTTELAKKTSSTSEISLPDYLFKISKLKEELRNLK